MKAFHGLAAIACLALTWAGNAAAAQTIRVVCYNIEADTNGNTAPKSGLSTVLEAIGENYVNGAPHPFDLLALEETTSNAATVAPIVAALNDYYGAGTYALVSYQGTQRGSATTGNGPSAMIYNTLTVQVIPQNGAQAVGVPGTPTSGSGGAPRQAIRYQLMPVGGAAGSSFYVYVTHMKSSASGDPTVNQTSRNTEATLIHTDIGTLPVGSSVLAVGDFNMDGSAEPAYQTLTTPDAAQLVDPLNYPQNNTQTWNTTAFLPILSESATNLRYRDDIQFMSPTVYSGTSAVGLHYMTKSSFAFGNNGTVPLRGSVNQTSNTALNGLQGPVSPASALAALTTASDHLPVVTDYTVEVTTPYASWQSRYFSSRELAETAISGDDADPDGDGIVNLLEYALNLDPRQVGVAGLPSVAISAYGTGQFLTLTYTRVIAATDITYTPQVSTDLATWTSGANDISPLSTTNNPDGQTQTVVVRASRPISSENGVHFMRLLITRP